mmetsp:Transcript_6293/g.8555  ORF Transcript_6293/g.8555 Transcript_6293/m.8555 type:complete len:228 (-) Transcript_6293:77-760(-)
MIKSDPFALPLGAVSRATVEDLYPGGPLLPDPHHTHRGIQTDVKQEPGPGATHDFSMLSEGPARERLVAVLMPSLLNIHISVIQPRSWMLVFMSTLQVFIARYLLRWTIFSPKAIALHFCAGILVGVMVRLQRRGVVMTRAPSILVAGPLAWLLLLQTPTLGLMVTAVIAAGHSVQIFENLDRLSWILMFIPHVGIEFYTGIWIGACTTFSKKKIFSQNLSASKKLR